MKKSLFKTEKQSLLHVIVVFVLIVVVGIVIFLNFYSRYIDKILYAERFSQMREVTEQLFTGLDDEVNTQ